MMQETSLITGTGDATAELQDLPHGKEEVGEWQRNQGEASGMMRIGRNYSQEKKKTIWKRRKVDNF